MKIISPIGYSLLWLAAPLLFRLDALGLFRFVDKLRQSRFLTWANLISLFGMALTGFVWWQVLTEQYLPALICFTVAALTDFADGKVARWLESSEKHIGISLWGQYILDPLRDKFLGTIIIPLAISADLGYWWPIGLIVCEIVLPSYFSYHLNQKVKNNITQESKYLTGFQFSFIAYWLLIEVCVQQHNGYAEMIMFVLTGATIFRSVSYYLAYKKA